MSSCLEKFNEILEHLNFTKCESYRYASSLNRPSSYRVSLEGFKKLVENTNYTLAHLSAIECLF